MKVMKHFKAFLYSFLCLGSIYLYTTEIDKRASTPLTVVSSAPAPTTSVPVAIVPPPALETSTQAIPAANAQPAATQTAAKEASTAAIVASAATAAVAKVNEEKASAEKKIEEEKAKLEDQKAKKDKEDKEKLDKEKEQLEKDKEQKEKEDKDKEAKQQEEKEKLEKEKEKLQREKLEKEKEKPDKDKEKKKKEVIAEEKREEKVISTLDNMGIEDEGNWLLKRVWWEQAEATFEKIIEVNDQIIQSQTDYFNKNKDIEKQLISNFRKLGYEQGELDEIISYLLDQMNRERQLEGDLSLQERQFIDLLNEKKSEIEKLKRDLEILESQDALIEDALTELINQINKSREYERKAWSDFKEIGRVLNDKKAKVLFYQIDASLKNVQNILNYAKGDLNNFFDTILSRAKSLLDSISAQVNSLSKEGLNLKEKFEEYKKLDEQKEQESKKRKEDIEKSEKTKSKKKKGWLETIGEWVIAPIDWIKSFF